MNNYINNTKAREYSFKFFYQLESHLLNTDTLPSIETVEGMIEEFDNLYFEPDAEHPDNIMPPQAKSFALTLVKTVINNIEELLPILEAKLTKKSLKNLDKVCLAVLFLGASEIKFYKKTPKTVVINDCINIAKKYGTPEIASFVNGVLDKV